MGTLKQLRQRKEILASYGLKVVEERNNKHFVWTVENDDGYSFKLVFPRTPGDFRAMTNFERDIKLSLEKGGYSANRNS